MTEKEFETKFTNFELDDQYQEFILNFKDGIRLINNGKALVNAVEDYYLFDEFKASLVK